MNPSVENIFETKTAPKNDATLPANCFIEYNLALMFFGTILDIKSPYAIPAIPPLVEKRNIKKNNEPRVMDGDLAAKKYTTIAIRRKEIALR